MTSTAPILPPGTGSLPPLGPPPGGQRPSADRVSGAGQGPVGAREPERTLPGREPAGPQAPGQTQPEAAPLRPGRPLLGGGPFTLAVAFGLQADQSQQPASAGSADNPAQAAEIAATQAAGREGGTGPNQLTEEEQKVVRELQQRDQEVRRHEAAHAAAGGQYAGAPTYTYQRGPDGRQYAVGGSVSIDTAPVKGDPEATLQKARQIRAAALAPADPSGQDKSVAAAASALERQAQAEIAAERRSELTGESGGQPASSDDSPDTAAAADTRSAEGSGEAAALTIAGPQDGAAPSGDFNAGGPAIGGSAGASEERGGAASALAGTEEGGVGPRIAPSSAFPAQASPFDIAGPVARASTGFDSRIPPPQVVSITV